MEVSNSCKLNNPGQNLLLQVVLLSDNLSLKFLRAFTHKQHINCRNFLPQPHVFMKSPMGNISRLACQVSLLIWCLGHCWRLWQWYTAPSTVCSLPHRQTVFSLDGHWLGVMGEVFRARSRQISCDSVIASSKRGSLEFMRPSSSSFDTIEGARQERRGRVRQSIASVTQRGDVMRATLLSLFSNWHMFSCKRAGHQPRYPWVTFPGMR